MSAAPTTLDEVVEDLKRLAKSDDPEGAHAAADKLLLAAIAITARDADARRIANAYGAIEKWYA